MKILQTPARFMPYIGGVENYAYCLSRELIRLGHFVKVVCAAEPYLKGEKKIYLEGIEINRLTCPFKIANTNITPGLPGVLLREDFDLIHTYLPTPWSADWSAVAAILKNKPLFLSYFNDITGNGINKFIATAYNLTGLKLLLNRADKIFVAHQNYIASSPFLHKFSHKIIVAPPGVDLERFKPMDLPKNKENIIFFLSILDKFHRYKGLEYLIMSIKSIIDKTPLKLYIGGGGELLGNYKKLVQEQGLEKSIFFLGFIDDKEIVKYYNQCDIFVLPSISHVQEGFGMVALEAMACKKPVIVTEITGVASTVRSKNAGVVVKPADVNALSEALAYLLLHGKDRQIMGENAYNLVKTEYSWGKHASIVEKQYMEITGLSHT